MWKYHFKRLNRERDKVFKQFGDWQILKKFTSELVRNNYFKTMTKESNRVYRLKVNN